MKLDELAEAAGATYAVVSLLHHEHKVAGLTFATENGWIHTKVDHHWESFPSTSIDRVVWNDDA